MHATESRGPASEQPLLLSIVDLLADPSAVVVLLATLCGFVLPMLWIYPPVAPRPSDFLNETHSKLGLNSNKLDNEDASRGRSTSTKKLRAADAGDDRESEGRIDSLWVYPIKSCSGIQVSRSRVLPSGLEFDRLFTFAQLRSPFPARAGAAVGDGIKESDEEDGLETWDAITQRQFPKLASLQVELWRPDLAKVRRAQARMRADDRAERSSSMSELYVVVRYPWQATGWAGRWDWFAAKMLRGWCAEPEVEVVLPISLPAANDSKAQAAAKAGRIQLSTGTVRGLDLSAELPRSLQLYLGVSNRLGLLRFDLEEAHKIMKPVYLFNKTRSQASKTIDQKDKEVPETEERLRANVVVNGIAANFENTWECVSFKPPSTSQSLLDEAKFQATHHQMPGGSPSTNANRGIELTPVFDMLDKPDLMELTLEAGMSVYVLQKRP